MSTEQTRQKQRTGVVVNAGMTKTLVVKVERRAPHPQYGKMVRHAKKYHAHDEAGTAKPGDVVRIEECRPMSRTKRWRLVAVLEHKAPTPPAAKAENRGEGDRT